MTDHISGKPFHSAVNRIPVPRPKVLTSIARRSDLGGVFGDGMAVGHDYLDSDRWSGSIDLEMIVRTPLIFGEQEKRDGQNGPSTVSLPMHSGQLFVPPTMVKGMISRAYETLTASRFRVFGDHKTPLTYRSDPAAALALIPLRVVERRTDGSLSVELFRGDTTTNGDYEERGVRYPAMRAAALQDMAYGHAHLAPGMTTERMRKLTPHGKKITCDMSLCLHGSGGRGGKYSYWQVTHVYTSDGQRIELVSIDSSVPVVDSLSKVEAFVYRTTPDHLQSKDLFNRKHDEKVFFDIDSRGAERVTVSSKVAEAYEVVVRSYEAERRREDEQKLPQKNRHKPNRVTHSVLMARRNASIEVVEDALKEVVQLKAGDLAFAVVGEVTEGMTEVLEIVPMMVGRHAYEQSPWRLAADQQVLPLSRKEEASPADRLFGYVVKEPKDDASRGDVAYCGRLSFGVVDTSEARISNNPKLLAPLLGAKLGSARRFLTDSSGKTPNDHGKNLPRLGFYVEGQHLGAVAFPVHRTLIGKTNFPSSATELPPTEGMEAAGDKTRVKAANWVEPGSVLRCRIAFNNLAEAELAALLWVLNPENLVPEMERTKSDACGYLRMGLGKPLGLGAVEVRVAEDGVRAHQGRDQSEQYAALNGCCGYADSPQSADSFTLPSIEVLQKTPWVQALQRAAFGYSDGTPVRYMTLNENKANNQTDFRTGLPKAGAGCAPGDLSENPRPLVIPIDSPQSHRP